MVGCFYVGFGFAFGGLGVLCLCLLVVCYGGLLD